MNSIRLNIGMLSHRKKLILTRIFFVSGFSSMDNSLESIPVVDPCLPCIRPSGYELGLDMVYLVVTFLGISDGVWLGASLGAMNISVDGT